MRDSVGLITVAQQQPVLDAFSGICQLCHGSFSGDFPFTVEPATNSLCCMLMSVRVFAFCFQAPM